MIKRPPRFSVRLRLNVRRRRGEIDVVLFDHQIAIDLWIDEMRFVRGGGGPFGRLTSGEEAALVIEPKLRDTVEGRRMIARNLPEMVLDQAAQPRNAGTNRAV